GAGRWLDARADFQQALQLAETDALKALNQNNVAWASLMANDPALNTEALELASSAYRFSPNQPAFAGTYAHALLVSGDPAGAKVLLEQTIPRHHRPRDRALNLCLLAMCQARLGEPEAAQASIEKAAELSPECQLLERARDALSAAALPASAGS
ncbi:MAG TPA: hypothetical protein VF134_08485, partial [Candidatus Dormibacteraeota bacterium]